MADSYSANLKLATPAPGSSTWNNELNANRAILDSQNALGDLAVTAHDVPVSTSLLFDVSAGLYVNQAGLVTSYAGALSQAVSASQTTYVYLTNAGALTLSTSGFPGASAVYVPLAVIVSGATTLTSITDARAVYRVVGG